MVSRINKIVFLAALMWAVGLPVGLSAQGEPAREDAAPGGTVQGSTLQGGATGEASANGDGDPGSTMQGSTLQLGSTGEVSANGDGVPGSTVLGGAVPEGGALSAGRAISDSVVGSCTSVSTEKIMLLQCPWSESSNVASLLCLDCRDRVARAALGYDHQEGDYRLFREPREHDRFGFYTNGWSALGNWRFYGSFSYFNEVSRGVRWVDVMDPYNGNPYSVGDSVGGDYSREYFLMEGKSALRVSDRLGFGVDVKYKTGVGAKRKDPRPENNLTDFEISPGVIWTRERLKLGAHLRFGTGKEEISFTSVTGNKFDLFYFRGLGAYSVTMEDDSRYTGKLLFGGGVQGNYNGSTIKNLTSVDFSRQLTSIKRGDAYPLQVVSLDGYTTEASTLFLFQPEADRLGRLQLRYRHERSYGDEPVVEPRLEEISWQWSTAARYTLYWHRASLWGARYAWYSLRDRHHLRHGVTLTADYGTQETTYYFVPEFNRQKISHYDLEATFEKGWVSGHHHLVAALSGGYRGVPSKRLDIVEEEVLRKGVLLEFTEHDFGYLTEGRWAGGMLLDYGREVDAGKTPFEWFLEAGYRLTGSGFRGGTERHQVRISTGIHF